MRTRKARKADTDTLAENTLKDQHRMARKVGNKTKQKNKKQRRVSQPARVLQEGARSANRRQQRLSSQDDWGGRNGGKKKAFLSVRSQSAVYNIGNDG